MSKPAKRFGKILVATDGSAGAQQACEVAAQVAAAFDSKVVIMRAIPSVSALAAPLEGKYYAKIIAKGKEDAERAAAVFEKAGVAVASEEVPQGEASPAETILDYASDEGADLIAMGTRGLGGFRRVALGSVSSAVALHAQCATLVVRGKGKIDRFLVAVDGSENAGRALAAAVDMAKRLEADLTVAHVVTVPGTMWSAGLPGSTVPVGEIEEDAAKVGNEVLTNALKVARDGGVADAKGELVEKLTSPAQGLVELAEGAKSDLVVVGTRGNGGFKRLLLGSVANSVLHYAPCSVLVVR